MTEINRRTFYLAGLAVMLAAAAAHAADTLPPATNIVISEFMALNDSTSTNSLGKYEDWIELYNPLATDESLSGWHLTDNAGNLTKWTFPAGPASVIAAKGYLLVWADNKTYALTNGELHASFALSGGGEYLALVEPDGTTLACQYAPQFPAQLADVSYGIGATNEYRAFTHPTPGGPNDFGGLSGSVADTKFNPGRGFYSNAVEVTVTCATALAEIRYTTDGSAPTEASALYTGPLTITNTTCLRAAAYKAGCLPTDVDTHTYLFVRDVVQQPVFSDTIRSHPVWGPQLDDALLALPSVCLVTANALSLTEGGASVELVFPDGRKGFQLNGAAELYGGHSLTYPKNSIRLSFKQLYGPSKLTYALFGDGAADEFDQILLRSGSHDGVFYENGTKGTFIRQGWVGARQRDMGQPAPRDRYVHLYLNGTYWGQYDLMERPEASFFAAYLGGVKDDYDALNSGSAIDGDTVAWNALTAAAGDYAALQSYMNVTNYADYMLLQFYGGNDWDWNPDQNWMAGRKREPGAGYRFICWDSDMDLRRDANANVVDRGGPGNMWGTIRQQAEFRMLLADRVQKWFFNNGPLTPDRVIAQLDGLAGTIATSVIAETARWGQPYGYTPDTWLQSVSEVKTRIVPGRTATVLRQLREAGVLPVIDAPAFSQHGGLFATSLNLAVSSTNLVYYTTDGSDPRQYGTGAATGTQYADGVALTRTTRVKARARTPGGVWSALTDAVFTLSEMPALRVTELMAHPRRPVSGSGDGEDEFIELRNAGTATVGLTGLRFTQGVSFDFTECAVQTLNPGEYLLVVRNIAAFTNRYPAVPPQRIAGAFAFPSTRLDDAGEKLELQDALGRALVSFTYNNSWLPATDGAGHSLIPVAGVAQADGELDYPGNWKASVYIGGSPGQDEPVASALSLVLNEILAHTDYNSPPYDSNDGIELYNVTAAPVTLGAGWYLSDDPENLIKWAIPAANSLAAHGWRYFDEIHDFHAPITNGFGLNKVGEQVLLSYLPGTGQDRVVDTVSFKGQENGVPLVRYPDGAASWFYGVLTPGASNRLAAAGVVIAELMYHPRPTAANPENNGNDEFVELHNPTAQPVTLMNLVENVGVWRLAGGTSYLFPDNTVLPAGGRLAVAPFDPAVDLAARDAFLVAYGLTNGEIRLFGPYSGQLNNKTDTVRLERPVSPDVAGDEVSWHAVDAVTYYDAAPWPTRADGTGRPLTRLPGRNSGDAAASWVAGISATPGLAPAKIAITAPAADTGYLAPASVSVTAEVDPAFVSGAVHQIVFAVDGVDVASASAPPYRANVVLDASEGVRRLTARLTDGEGDTTSSSVPVMAYTNIPAFTATANPAINLTVTDRVNLHATAAVLPGMTNPVSFFWSCPGDSSVVFENPAQADAAARFTRPGRYELRLTMFYGRLATNRFVTVTAAEANTVNRVPYRENFETYEQGSALIGIGGWYGADTAAAVVEDSLLAGAGSGGYPLAGPHEQSLSFSGGVSNLFEQTGSLTNVCVDMLLACQPGEDEGAPELTPETQVAFWVSGERRLLVWHGLAGSTNRWTELPDVTVGTNAYMRLTLLADYGRDPQGSFGFRLWVNREPVTLPVDWFATASTNRSFFSGMTLMGSGQAEDLVVASYNSMLYRRITAAAGPHGRVAPAGEVLVPAGSSTNITMLPDAYCRVGSVAVDGQAVGPVLSYAFTNVWDEHALQADFLANLTASGVPEFWLNNLKPAWTNRFDEHEQKDLDGDGANNAQEYVAGTDATNAQSVFRLAMGTGNGAAVVSFATVPSGGFYGLGGIRRYALEVRDDLAAGDWRSVAGFDAVAGAGQSVAYTNRMDGAERRFFRGRVWMAP